MKENRKAESGLRRWLRCLVRRWRDHKQSRSIAAIRGHMEFFGYGVADLSDEEIEAAVTKYGKRLAKCGLSTEEVAIGFQRISNALKANR